MLLLYSVVSSNIQCAQLHEGSFIGSLMLMLVGKSYMLSENLQRVDSAKV